MGVAQKADVTAVDPNVVGDVPGMMVAKEEKKRIKNRKNK